MAATETVFAESRDLRGKGETSLCLLATAVSRRVVSSARIKIPRTRCKGRGDSVDAKAVEIPEIQYDECREI